MYKNNQHQRSVKTLSLSGNDDELIITEIRRLLNHYQPQYRHNVLLRIKDLVDDVAWSEEQANKGGDAEKDNR